MSTQPAIPVGYLRDAQDRLVPIDNIDEIDLTRSELIAEIVKEAQALQLKMSTFKSMAMGDVNAFVDLAAEKYDVKLGGKKGNITLLSFDGKQKIQIAVADRLHFDERIHAAKALVDECIHEWTEGSRSEIKALIQHAFQTDKEGKVNTGRILNLMRLSINDSKWNRAMEALKDSMQVLSSTAYIRIYERQGDSDKYVPIVLDMAAL
ncbi:MAG: DUF3164 family protein [Chromatiales bacterium]|nr:DUF3164 family protein [Gammaproteobacteria bacterium]